MNNVYNNNNNSIDSITGHHETSRPIYPTYSGGRNLFATNILVPLIIEDVYSASLIVPISVVAIFILYNIKLFQFNTV